MATAGCWLGWSTVLYLIGAKLRREINLELWFSSKSRVRLASPRLKIFRAGGRTTTPYLGGDCKFQLG